MWREGSSVTVGDLRDEGDLFRPSGREEGEGRRKVTAGS
jgi:hypothetical protein